MSGKLIVGVFSCLCVSAACFGGSVQVTAEPFPSHMENATVTTSFNGQDSRAWVEISLYHTEDREAAGEQQIIRKSVPGLRMDPASHEVVYETNGKSVVCAKIRGERVEDTGKCTLTEQTLAPSPRTPSSKLDDGFTVRYEPVLAVELDVKG
jgi:hypothetical protein